MAVKQGWFAHSDRPRVSRAVYDGDIRQSVERALALIGGLGRLIQKDDIVLLKPNYNSAHPFPGSSDPDFVRVVIEMLYEAGAIKLAMGFVKPFFDQVTFHARHLREKLAELALVIRPDLIIMDARKVFIAGGPARGELRAPGLILASGNQVAIDVEGVKILQSYPGNSLEGKSPWDLVQIRHAVELGLGPASPEEYDVVTD